MKKGMKLMKKYICDDMHNKHRKTTKETNTFS